jgi:hypothetical protein
MSKKHLIAAGFALITLIAALFVNYLNSRNKKPAQLPTGAAPSKIGLGVCHWPGTDGLKFYPYVNWFYWGGGGGQDWKELEPQQGHYDFSRFDSEFASHFSRFPGTRVFLNISTAMPQSLPEWIKNRADEFGYIKGPYSSSSSFAPWNQNYQQALRSLLLATSQHINSPSFQYKDKIKGVIIMGGGWYGEMITWEDTSSPIYQKWLSLGYDDDKYLNSLLEIISFYNEAFPNRPLVLQIASGLYGRTSFLERAVNQVTQQYGSRVYIKWNGWSWNKIRQHQGKYQVLAQAAQKTLVGLEPAALPGNVSKTELLNGILETLNEIPVSMFCFQND